MPFVLVATNTIRNCIVEITVTLRAADRALHQFGKKHQEGGWRIPESELEPPFEVQRQPIEKNIKEHHKGSCVCEYDRYFRHI